MYNLKILKNKVSTLLCLYKDGVGCFYIARGGVVITDSVKTASNGPKVFLYTNSLYMSKHTNKVELCLYSGRLQISKHKAVLTSMKQVYIYMKNRPQMSKAISIERVSTQRG